MNENVAAVFEANVTMAGSWPFIRLFSVVEAGATTPQRDLAPFVSHSSTPCSFPQFPIADSAQKCNTWQTATEPTVIGAFSAHCFYTALELSKQLTDGAVLGMIHSSVSGTPMKLWMDAPALAKCDAAATSAASGDGAGDAASASHRHATLLAPAIPAGNSTLYNAMIAPLSRYAVRGVVWNQGESDGGEALPYFACLFQSLIASWRAAWRIGDFAWVFAQLGAQDSTSWPNYWPFMPRLAQAAALPGRSNLSTTNTVGMAVAYDIGDMGSPYPPDHVHSRRKHELGRRTALAMLHVQYALQWPASPGLINLTATANWAPPALLSVTTAGAPAGAAVLRFTAVGGLSLNATADAWEGCAAGDTVQFGKGTAGEVWTNATVVARATGDPSQLELVATPVAGAAADFALVRMGAALWPQCTVYGVGNGLPVEPFFTPIAAAAAAGAAAAGAASSKSLLARAPAPGSLVVTAARGPRTWTTWKGRSIAPAPAPGIIAATPPMGYNSWNGLHCNIDENMMRKTAETLLSTGLAAYGFVFVNMDDCWQVRSCTRERARMAAR